jgi:hypothetical protein
MPELANTYGQPICSEIYGLDLGRSKYDCVLLNTYNEIIFRWNRYSFV